MIKNKRNKIFIVAGGTGGHVFPALAVYNKLNESSDKKATFITDSRGQRFLKLEINQKKLCIKASNAGLIKKLTAIITLGVAFLQSIYLILTLRPNSIVGFGGYPTFPMILAAFILRKKIYIHEQNSVLGKANKLGAKFAKKIFLSFEDTKQLNSEYEHKTILIGNPVRKEIERLYSEPYQNIRQGDKINILVIGGSQGSNIFNDVVPEAILKLPPEIKSRINIVQQVRKDSIDAVKKKYEEGNVSCKIAGFFDDIAKELKVAHLVICRSGASTIAELAVSGKPAIFVPLKNSAHNHQKINAEYLVDKDSALMLEEKEFDKGNLVKILEEFIVSDSKLQTYSANIRKLAQLDVSVRIVNFIEL